MRALLAALAALLVLAPGARAATVPVDQGAAALQSQLQAAASAVAPSVVQVRTGDGLGSGVVLDDDGDIVTNAHVVEDFAEATVVLPDGSRRRATVVGSYPLVDVAVVRIAAATPPAATFADSDAVRPGQIVLALGSPLGLRGSVTQGIVSALNRALPESADVMLGGLIQFSAPIFPGNSGGALVDLQGAVVGLPTLGSDSAGGLGFAIPSNTVVSIGRQLAASGRVSHSGLAWLGLVGAPVRGGGLRVLSVNRGGPAAGAGIERRSTLLAIGARRVSSVLGVKRVLLAHRPGDVVPVFVRQRDGDRRVVQVTLGERPA